ncbi:lipopolysaccharide biosynthesis protein [Photobacterium damselae subsp. damselae]|uniref:Lipopolysaccharide biosynthesis protein n=1 Tax=Photobacterium damselae subsp. damselae TaxID=85581 RepID=A0A850QR12_PHODD|nr:lipopolysaccharide biosynthesis protein [Photobacterium damselae subsp. damselae]
MNGYFWTIIEKIFSLLLAIISIIVLPRYLSASDFGVVAIVTIYINICNTLVDSGFGGALIQKKKVDDIDYNTVYIFNIISSIILYIIIFFSSDYIAEFYKSGKLSLAIKVASLSLLLSSLYLIHIVKFTRELNFKIQTKINLLARSLSLILSIAMAINGFSYWSLIIPQICSHLIILTICKYNCNYFFKFEFSLEALKKMAIFGSSLVGASLVKVGNNSLLAVIIGKFWGVNIIGYYSQANRFNELYMTNVISILDKVSFPHLVKVEKIELKSYVSKLFFNVCYLVFPLICIIIINSKEVILILLGNEWLGSVIYLKFLAVSGFCLIVETIGRNIIKARGFGKELLFGELIKLMLAIPVLLICSQFSIEILLIGYIILTVVNMAINIFIILYKIKISLSTQLVPVLKVLFLSLSSLLLTIYIAKMLDNYNMFLLLGMKTIGYCVIYIGISYFCKIDILMNLLKYRK